MKKFLSVVLATCIIGTALISMSSCSFFKKKINAGTEAAKLLLANERLDEKLVGSKIDIGMLGQSEKSVLTAQNLLSDLPTKTLLAGENDISLTPLSSLTAHTWSSFPKYSSSMVEFSQFISSVENEVQNVSESIANMKNDVGITDKWVSLGYEKQMLRVYENYDVLLVKGMYEDIHVYYRYTDEATAKNYYETYSFMSYEDGTTGDIRTLFIPNERYESMYNNSNGFTDYFIAENSRGYWMNTRFSYLAESSGYRSANFWPYVVKDGLGFGCSLSINNMDDLSNSQTMYSIFEPSAERELFRIYDASDSYQFDLYIPAIKNGFVSVSSNEAYNDVDENVYQAAFLSKITTTKGTYDVINDYSSLPENKFTPCGGYVQHIFGDQIYYGSIGFAMPNPQMSIDEACLQFSDYAKSLGLELYCDMDIVAKSAEHASLLSDGFYDSFEWNGYKMSSIENVEKAREVLQKDFDNARADYEAVKDYETVTGSQELSKDAHFAKLDTLVSNGNVFDGTTIKLEEVTASTSDTILFEDKKEYVLKVGISLIDGNNNPIGVNTVALGGTAPTSVAFSGDSINLSAKGEYEIPKNLGKGRYAVVVYIATKDEGIRVSEIQKIAFVDIKEGKIESSAMNIEIFAQNNNLIVEYEIKNTHKTTLKATKDSFSYDEVKRLVTIEILTYGAPYHGAELEDENGNAISADATLKKGTYRMMCYLATNDGLAQSYVYLTIE